MSIDTSSSGSGGGTSDGDGGSGKSRKIPPALSIVLPTSSSSSSSSSAPRRPTSKAAVTRRRSSRSRSRSRTASRSSHNRSRSRSHSRDRQFEEESKESKEESEQSKEEEEKESKDGDGGDGGDSGVVSIRKKALARWLWSECRQHGAPPHTQKSLLDTPLDKLRVLAQEWLNKSPPAAARLAALPSRDRRLPAAESKAYKTKKKVVEVPEIRVGATGIEDDGTYECNFTVRNVLDRGRTLLLKDGSDENGLRAFVSSYVGPEGETLYSGTRLRWKPSAGSFMVQSWDTYGKKWKFKPHHTRVRGSPWNRMPRNSVVFGPHKASEDLRRPIPRSP